MSDKTVRRVEVAAVAFSIGLIVAFVLTFAIGKVS